MICPHCRQTTTPVAGRCGLCHRALNIRPAVATGVLTPVPPGNAPDVSGDVTSFGNLPGSGDDVTNLPPAGPHHPPPASKISQGPSGYSAPIPSGTGSHRPLAVGPLAPGQAFGSRYHIIRLLGIGGMGAVYQAWDAELGVAVAIKVIRPEVTADPLAAAELERRFKRELLLAREVTHKNVVRIHDLGEIDGIKYITMPYIQGHDLATVLKTGGKLPVAVALRIAKQVAAGLQAAHEAGVIHRDLKPANIMVDDDEHACIMDFGIARGAAGGGGTMLGAVVGTVDYMAPEQARGENVDQRADIYAFGLILYDLLGGRQTSGRSSSVVTGLMARMQSAPAPLRTFDAQIPEAIDRIIGRCLQPATDARYQTMAELTADLDALDADGHPFAGRTLSPGHTSEIRLGSVSLPRPSWKWPVAAAILVAVATSGYLLRDRVGAPTPPAAVTGQPVSLAILPFRNASGDSSLDWLGATFAETLRAEVGGSTQLRTISSDRLYQILRDLKIAPDAAFDPPTLKRLADFSNSQTVVWGQYVKFGTEIRFDATLQDVGTGRAVPLRASAVNEAALLSAIGQLGQAIREHLALGPDVIKELEASTFKPSSQSFQALRYYSEGQALARQGKHSDALKKFEAATHEDANFALAYSRLAQTYASLGYDQEADRFSRKAAELSEALPPREKYLIQASHARILNDTKQAITAYVNLVKVAPDDLDVHFNLAGLYEQTGAFDLARDHAATVLKADPKNLAALIQMGRLEIRRRNWQASLDHLNPALSLAIQLENDEARGDTLHAIGVVYKRLNKPGEALQYYTQALEIKRRIGQKGSIANTVNEIAQVQSTLGRPDEALKSYTESLRLRREIGDKRGTGNSLLDLGNFNAEMGRYDVALTYYKDSLQIQRELGNENYQGLCLNNIGNMYLLKGQYDDALIYFERALEIRERAKIPSDTALTLHNLAMTSGRLGDYDQALSYHLRALDLWRTAGNKREASMELHRMAEIFEYQGRYGAAVKSKQEALSTLRELKDRSDYLAHVLSGVGHALTLSGQFEEAGKHLAEALDLSRELKLKALEARILNFEGESFFYQGDLTAARDRFERAMAMATETKDREVGLLVRSNLTKLSAKERPEASAATLGELAREADAAGLDYLAVDSSLALAEASVDRKAFAQARADLEQVVARADRLGLRLLLAKAHFLSGVAARAMGRAAEASRHVDQATRLRDEITKETGSDTLKRRADLSALYR